MSEANQTKVFSPARLTLSNFRSSKSSVMMRDDCTKFFSHKLTLFSTWRNVFVRFMAQDLQPLSYFGSMYSQLVTDSHVSVSDLRGGAHVVNCREVN